MADFEACRYLAAPNGSTVPEVMTTDPIDPQMPCAELTGKERTATLVAQPISSDGCKSQRSCELCPRGLTLDVNPALQLNRLAK